MRRTAPLEEILKPAADGIAAVVTKTLMGLAPNESICSCRGYVVKILEAGEPEPSGPACCDACGQPAWRVYLVYPDTPTATMDEIDALLDMEP